MSGNSRNTGISSLNNNRPTAKRSPSILVTDARSDKVKGARAPFAGQSYKKQQQQLQQQQKHSNYSFQQLQHLNAYREDERYLPALPQYFLPAVSYLLSE